MSNPTTPLRPSPLAPLELLRTIRRLDRQRDGGRNYLPIYLLRDALPEVPREHLDQALRLLVMRNWLRMSLIQETRLVTPEQLAAGIPSQGGTIRFFLVVMPDAPATEPEPEPEPLPLAASPATEPPPTPAPAAAPAPAPPARPKGRRRLPAAPADAPPPSPVRHLRLALDLRQADLAELLGVGKLSVIRWEQATPEPAPLLLRAALEAHRRGCLPRPEPADGPWGWHARLFAALATPSTCPPPGDRAPAPPGDQGGPPA